LRQSGLGGQTLAGVPITGLDLPDQQLGDLLVNRQGLRVVCRVHAPQYDKSVETPEQTRVNSYTIHSLNE
jgi:hypothetical protein